MYVRRKEGDLGIHIKVFFVILLTKLFKYHVSLHDYNPVNKNELK